jgi:predicted NBD/HSP70 family sugar kinase/biotin operon repressor
MAKAPGSLESLRLVNRARVIAALQQRGRASRADIVRATGLSRTTVSSLVGELLADGVVIEQEDGPGQSPSPNGGRPATLLALDPASGGFAGIDFGHDSVRVIVVDRAGEVLLEGRTDLDVDNQATRALQVAAQMVDRLRRQAGVPRERLLGVGAAVSAPLRSGRHAFASERIFPSWGEVDVAAALATALGVPVQVGNDANLGALAEVTFGAGRGERNVLYAMLSAGVGAGIILDGRLYEGDTGTAGELGHVVVEPGGAVCRCGNRGCLETVAGVSALTRALEHAHGPAITVETLLSLCAAADPGARRLVADAGRAVGQALAAVCSILDPGLVILGGELAATGDVLLSAVREHIDDRTSAATGHRYQVIAGALSDRAEALGAAALAMNNASAQQLEAVNG